MQGAFKIQNDAQAMNVVRTVEKLILITVTNTVQQLSISGDTVEGQYFQKLEIFPGSAVDPGTGVLTANAGDIHVGLSGAAATKVLPDKRASGDVDFPLIYELPLGQKMKLSQVIIVGTQNDGVFIRFT